MLAQYWRVRFWGSTGADDIWLAEVEFIGADGTVLVPGTVWASSTYASSYPAAEAFDGIYLTGNGWASASRNCWIGGDYGVPTDIEWCRLRMAWQSSADDELPLLTACALEYSHDNVAWFELTRSAAGNNVPGGVVELREMPPPTISVTGVRVVREALVDALCVVAPSRLMLTRDVEFGGRGRIFGTTKLKGTTANLPVKARVVLHHQRSRLPVRQTWSDPVTGDFSFDGIDIEQEFVVVAEDAAGQQRAVAAQRLIPEEMP